MRRRRFTMYSVHWAEQLINSNRAEIIKQCKEIERITIPPCKCVGKIWYRKLRNREALTQLKLSIDELVQDGSND